jgi:hypothetical protein
MIVQHPSGITSPWNLSHGLLKTIPKSTFQNVNYQTLFNLTITKHFIRLKMPILETP